MRLAFVVVKVTVSTEPISDSHYKHELTQDATIMRLTLRCMWDPFAFHFMTR